MKSIVCYLLLLALYRTTAQEPTPSKLDYGQLEETLNSNLELWKSKGGSTYTMTYQMNCFCPPEYNQPVNEQVVNSKVTCAMYSSNGGHHHRCGGPAKFNNTVENLFEMVGKAIENRYCTFVVNYDSTLGYPSSVHIASSCGISDVTTHLASNVRLGVDSRFCRHHHGRWHKRHGLGFVIGGVGLLVVFIVGVVLIRRYRRRRLALTTTTVTKKVGDAKYLHLQEAPISADTDIKKVPLV